MPGKRALLAVLASVGIPAIAMAQTAGQPPANPAEPDQPTAAGPRDDPAQSTTGPGLMGAGDSRWIAAAFMGSNFGAAANGSAGDFGGSVGYLWNNSFGGEFIAGFTPDFQVTTPALFAGESPQVNSFMFNAIGAVPLGIDGRWQPFVSGGVGVITMRSGALNNNAGNPISNLFDPDDTRAGADIGGGVMGFIGAWGIRADLRYFRAFNTGTVTTTTSDTLATSVASTVLPGLDFWRANIGVAFRW